MSHQSTTGRKRRGPPRTTGKGVTIGTRLQADLLSAIDRYIAQQGGTLTRAGAIRAIIAEHLGVKPGKPE